MRKEKESFVERFKFLYLLIALLLSYLVNPIFDALELKGSQFFLSLFLSILLFTGVYAVSRERRTFIIVLILVLPVFILSWLLDFFPSPSLLFLREILLAGWLIFIAVIIMGYVLRKEKVTFEKLSGAMCLYFLLGYIWAHLYYLIFLLQPGAFGIENPDVFNFTYYSFVTLSTLGYGDITPLSSIARAFASMEAIAGQLYIAILVARLVALHITHSREEVPGSS